MGGARRGGGAAAPLRLVREEGRRANRTPPARLAAGAAPPHAAPLHPPPPSAHQLGWARTGRRWHGAQRSLAAAPTAWPAPASPPSLAHSSWCSPCCLAQAPLVLAARQWGREVALPACAIGLPSWWGCCCSLAWRLCTQLCVWGLLCAARLGALRSAAQSGGEHAFRGLRVAGSAAARSRHTTLLARRAGAARHAALQRGHASSPAAAAPPASPRQLQHQIHSRCAPLWRRWALARARWRWWG